MYRCDWLNRTTCQRQASDDKWPTVEQSASLLASRLAVICDAEVAPRLLGVRRHISTSGRGGGDDVIVTWPVVRRQYRVVGSGV